MLTRSFYFNQPIAASDQIMMTELDLKDGFVHMSTAQQVPGVLKRFFADTPAVAILRLEYARLSAFKKVSWDMTSSGESEWRCLGLAMITSAIGHTTKSATCQGGLG